MGSRGLRFPSVIHRKFAWTPKAGKSRDRFPKRDSLTFNDSPSFGESRIQVLLPRKYHKFSKYFKFQVSFLQDGIISIPGVISATYSTRPDPVVGPSGSVKTLYTRPSVYFRFPFSVSPCTAGIEFGPPHEAAGRKGTDR